MYFYDCYKILRIKILHKKIILNINLIATIITILLTEIFVFSRKKCRITFVIQLAITPSLGIQSALGISTILAIVKGFIGFASDLSRL